MYNRCTQQSPLVTFTAAQDVNSATNALPTYASQLLMFSLGNRQLRLNLCLSHFLHSHHGYLIGMRLLRIDT